MKSVKNEHSSSLYAANIVEYEKHRSSDYWFAPLKELFCCPLLYCKGNLKKKKYLIMIFPLTARAGLLSNKGFYIVLTHQYKKYFFSIF